MIKLLAKSDEGGGSKSMASGAGNPGSPPQGAASEGAAQAIAAAPTAGQESVSLTKEELNSLLARAASEGAAQAIAQMALQPPRDTVVLKAEEKRDIQKETAKILALQADTLHVAEQQLLDGKYKWSVRVPGEPRMVKTVGTNDKLPSVAKAKFADFFGITAIERPDKQITAELVEDPDPKPATAAA